MGNVYEAHDAALDRLVAVKVLRPHVAQEPAFVDRFFREARAAARVSHPNLVHVYFVGRDSLDRAFFSMEVVPGKTLDEFVARGCAFLRLLRRCADPANPVRNLVDPAAPRPAKRGTRCLHFRGSSASLRRRRHA